MLFRAIKHQVDKGPVDAVTGKAKYTLNDNRLLREDVEYKTLVRTIRIVILDIQCNFQDLFLFLTNPAITPSTHSFILLLQTLNVLVQGGGVNETQPLPFKVLDCDTITQVKEKLLDQVYKGTSFSHRPHADSLDLGEVLRLSFAAEGTEKKVWNSCLQIC